MKLLRYFDKKKNTKEIGFLVNTSIYPLSTVLDTPPNNLEELFNTSAWKRLSTLRLPSLTKSIPVETAEFLPPIERPGKILCVGLNYRDHVLEGGREIPEFPTIFMKASSSVIGHHQAIELPQASRMVDLEAELAVVIGKPAKNIPADQAYDYIAGYTILNDVSERDYQKRTSQWTMGKSCDTFSPIGPVLVTQEEIPDPQTLEITSAINGYEMQHSNTQHLIFTVPYLIEYISAVMTLEPGDVISTGTPGGVGVFRNPPIFLKSGDVIEISIEGIGTLRNSVK